MTDVHDDPAFDRLLQHLKTARGFDFTGYKRPSLVRRVRRRMDAVGVRDFEAYLELLELDPAEFGELFDTILINVTAFFRDTESWDHLASVVLPHLLASRPEGQLRIWSAGCASGQEPYSVAIAVAELVGLDQLRDRVKIYATDVDEDALAQARSATYSPRQLRGLDQPLLDRYTEPDGSHRTLRPEIRRAVIFGRNDLVQDAPISHIDLLTCRNTLMYLSADTQGTVLARLHFALQPEGVMFLGRAEMLLGHTELFTPVDATRRFFRRATAEGRTFRGGTPDEVWRRRPGDADGRLRTLAAALLASPVAQVVLDEAGCMAGANHRAQVLFGLSERDVGTPFQDLQLSYRPVELRGPVDRAGREGASVLLRGVTLDRPGQPALVFDVHVRPLPAAADGTTIGTSVVFEDVTRTLALHEELAYANTQVESAYEELQASNEELETTNEELQSTVDELETTNEELQSTNEELKTMNEELQSMNDELQSTNRSQRESATELDEMNAFMEAVLAGLRSGVVVTDRKLRVTAWNARATDLWGLRADEVVGSPVFDLDIGLPVTEVRAVVEAQLDGSVAPHEGTRVHALNRRGCHVDIKVSVSPLRRDGDEPAGVILLMDEVG